MSGGRRARAERSAAARHGAAALLTLVVTGGTRAEVPSPPELVACALDAQGGTQRVAALRSIELTGRLEIPTPETPLAADTRLLYGRDGRLRLERILRGHREVSVVGGADGSWFASVFDGVVALEPRAAEALRVRVRPDLFALGDLLRGDDRATAARAVELDGEAVWELRAVTGSGHPYALWLSAFDCAPVGRSVGGMAVRYASLRPASGFRLPRRREPVDARLGTLTVGAVELDAELGAAELARPDDDASLGALVVARQRLSPTERLELLSTVWEEVGRSFYRELTAEEASDDVRARLLAGVLTAGDVESAFRVLAAWLDGLGASHTRLLLPREMDFLARGRAPALGFSTLRGAAGIVVDAVTPGSAADRLGVERGQEVVSVDGIPVAEALAEAGEESLFPLAAPAGTVRRVAVRDPADGGERVVELTQQPGPALAPGGPLEPLGRGVYRLEVGTFLPGSFSFSQARRALAAAGAARGLVLDLRRNRGGRLADAAELGALLVGPRELFAYLAPRAPARGRPAAVTLALTDAAALARERAALARGAEVRVVTGAERVLPRKVPIAVLVGPRTASGGELLADLLRTRRDAVVVGRRSAGRVLRARGRPLPGGGRLLVAIADVRAASGRRLEGVGVMPEVVVPLGAERDGADDPALAAAVAALLGRSP